MCLCKSYSKVALRLDAVLCLLVKKCFPPSGRGFTILRLGNRSKYIEEEDIEQRLRRVKPFHNESRLKTL